MKKRYRKLTKTMPSEELCKNCGRIIGSLEQAYVFQGQIVCNECNNKLRSENQPLVIRNNDFTPSQGKVQVPETLTYKNVYLLEEQKCPYCNIVLPKIPKRKTKCKSCGNYYYVKTRVLDKARVIVTKQEKDKIEAE